MAYPERSKLQYVIGKLTNPKRNSDTLLENHVGDLKQLCKQSNDNLLTAWKFLRCSLSKKSHERYLALLVTELLFARSSYMRKLVVDDFAFLKQQTLELDADPLPPPKEYASRLHNLSTRLIESWYGKYQKVYPALIHEYQSLKKQIKFPSDIEKERQEEEIRRERVVRLKVKQIAKELRKIAPQLDSLLSEMDNSFEILVPTDPFAHLASGSNCDENIESKLEEKETDVDSSNVDSLTILPESTSDSIELSNIVFESFGEDSDEEDSASEEEESEEDSEDSEEDNEFYQSFDHSSVASLKSNGLHSLDYAIDISVNSKTDVHNTVDKAALLPVIDHILDCIKLMDSKFSPLLKHWLDAFKDIDISMENHPQRNILHNYIISYNERVEAMRTKFSELNVDPKYIAKRKNKVRFSKILKKNQPPLKKRKIK